MRKVYAIIENNIVINKAVVDTDEQPFDIPSNWFQSKVAKKGDTRNPNTGKYTTPPPKPEPPKDILWDAFTRDQQVKIINHVVSAGILSTSEANKIKGV